jgi:hypothetical protein
MIGNLSGYMFKLCDACTYLMEKQEVALSTAEAEYIALSSAIQEAV